MSKSFFQKHPLTKHLLLMLAACVAIVGLLFLFIKIYSRHGEVYEIPDLTMQSINDICAHNVLELQFVVMDSIYREGEAGGLILTQEPKAGAIIKKGRKVYVMVTAYMPDDAVVPDITGGVTLRTAISQLESVGLKGGTLTFVDSPFRNTIVEMKYNGRLLNPGERLTNGAKIDLVVGIGDEPDKAYSIVPFVIGKKAERVHREILSASFNIGIENYEGVKNRNTAVVYKQEPNYNGVSRLEFGSRVNLWYCDADEQKINKMVNDFRVDSSTIDNTAPYPSSSSIEWGIDDTFEDEGLSW
ncbi:MAG: hypothetical protein IJ764_01375 [Bacteroidales bacterium]|nr:hypothetical protein [Bacteroidales bacterium]